MLYETEWKLQRISVHCLLAMVVPKAVPGVWFHPNIALHFGQPQWRIPTLYNQFTVSSVGKKERTPADNLVSYETLTLWHRASVCVLKGEWGGGSEGRRPQGDDSGRMEGRAGQGEGQGGVQHPQGQRGSQLEQRIRAAQVQGRSESTPPRRRSYSDVCIKNTAAGDLRATLVKEISKVSLEPVVLEVGFLTTSRTSPERWCHCIWSNM